MQICFSSLGEVKINDNINSLDVNSSGKKICSQNNFLSEMIFIALYGNNVRNSDALLECVCQS
jgi:hypothetical protein